MTAEQAAARSITGLGVSPLEVARLGEATPPKKVRQRQGNKQHQGDCQKQYGSCQLPHKMLDYVDARYVMDRLDEVVGPEFWQSDHRMEGEKVAAGIGILIDGTWVWKWDGAGETDIEGEKGSFSDSFKRAGVRWGIARDLYPDAATHQTSPAPAAGRAPSRPAAAAYIPPDHDSGNDEPLNLRCPVHNKPWTDKGRGKFCTGKMPDGSWCKERP